MSTATAQIASAAAAVKGLRYAAMNAPQKNCGAPLTAASLRLGGSYGELPLPLCKSGKKVDCSQQSPKSLPQICLQAIFRTWPGLLYPQFRRKRTNFYGLSL